MGRGEVFHEYLWSVFTVGKNMKVSEFSKFQEHVNTMKKEEMGDLETYLGG